MKSTLFLSCAASTLFLCAPAMADGAWDQFYFGLYSQYGLLDTNLSPANSYIFDVNGFSGGAMIGGDRQFGSFVAGIEADLGYDWVHGNARAPASDWIVATNGLEGSLRARGGYASGPSLFYLTAGGSFAPYNLQYNGGTQLVNQTQLGWTIGGGVEVHASEHLNIRGELLYTDFGNSAGLIVDPTISMRTTETAFRLGVSYRF